MDKVKEYINSGVDKLWDALKESWTFRAGIILTALQVYDATWPVLPDAIRNHWLGISATVLMTFLRLRTV